MTPPRRPALPGIAVGPCGADAAPAQPATRTVEQRRAEADGAAASPVHALSAADHDVLGQP